MMKRLFVLGLLITSCLVGAAKAQSLSTKIVRIEIDGKEVQENHKVFFLSNGNLIEAERTSTGFVIPNELKKEEHWAGLITSGKYKLGFSDIHILNFEVD
jgi:hypothetical protein